jgi:hypothetical protein
MVGSKCGRFLPAVFLGAALLAGCADSATGPGRAPGPRLEIGTGDEVCETINFNGFQHGNTVTTLTVFGRTITLSATAYDDDNDLGEVAGTAVIYDGNHVGGPEDFDLEATDQGTSPIGPCPDCGVQGNMLIIQDLYSAYTSDHIWGGSISFSGFGTGTGFYVKDYKMVDLDNSEVPSQLWVNGTNIAGTQVDAANAVQTVSTTSTVEIPDAFTFKLGTAADDGITGSGAFDDIRVCMRTPPPPGDEGCTPGYWKNHTSSWAGTGYTTGQTLGSVFTIPGSLSSLSSSTLLQALSFSGGSGTSGAARILLRAAVAALLNSAHSGVEYPSTTAEIIADVNAALASNDRDTMLELASDLDADNNLGCPLN